VWTGNFSGEPMYNLTGRQGAAPVWQEIMNGLHAQESSSPPLPPEGLVQAQVSVYSGGTARKEWFVAGTEPLVSTPNTKAAVRTRITYPIDQSVIAVDPDIPRNNPRMFIQIAAPRSDQNVYLNGRRIGRAQALLPWEPTSGQFLLEIRDSKGQVLDKVHFEVRGRRFALAK
jgi:penicillin-binding protein 1C